MRRRLLLLCALAVLGVAAPANAAQTSSNWAGYVASAPGVKFRHVRATWVVPTATCTAGQRAYEASWVGIGGYHTTSKALEQIGTESDCSRTGSAVYSAWYELVPSDSASIHISVRPGDTVTASVAVSGHLVTLRLADTTRGSSFIRTIRAGTVDTTSADWIVEAPSTCNATSCNALPLANFGSESFTGASATTAEGTSGGIATTQWAGTSIALLPEKGSTHYTSADLTAGEALAGALTSPADTFTVTYSAASTDPKATTTPPPATSAVGSATTASSRG